MTISQTDDRSLTFVQHETLKAVACSYVTMTASEAPIWRNSNRRRWIQGIGWRGGYAVTDAMLSLLQRKLAVADPTFTDGSRSATVTQAGYEALSIAHHHPPTKRRRSGR